MTRRKKPSRRSRPADERDEDVEFRCPSCRRPVARDSTSFPFCSERCRNVDLCHWLEERYRVPGPSLEDMFEEERGGVPGASDDDDDDLSR
ncbi:MAG TPA: DNA gyrase inhibitor YacG [Planctomycetota bacterium]|nr:DNA gyrase inhibitor YacG [Planctomycetota bacterium]